MNGRLKPFERAVGIISREIVARTARAAKPGVTDEEIEALYQRALKDEIWLNNEYQVNINKRPEHGLPLAVVWHLSIKRLDKRAIHDWRDLQAIKNMLVGPEYEAIELYPASSRTIDSVNQMHLWVLVSWGQHQSPMIPVGWNAGRLVIDQTEDKSTGQRGLHQEGRTL